MFMPIQILTWLFIRVSTEVIGMTVHASQTQGHIIISIIITYHHYHHRFLLHINNHHYKHYRGYLTELANFRVFTGCFHGFSKWMESEVWSIGTLSERRRTLANSTPGGSSVNSEFTPLCKINGFVKMEIKIRLYYLSYGMRIRNRLRYLTWKHACFNYVAMFTFCMPIYSLSYFDMYYMFLKSPCNWKIITTTLAH